MKSVKLRAITKVFVLSTSGSETKVSLAFAASIPGDLREHSEREE